MQSGKFQHLVTIERPVLPQNSAGDLVESWEPLTGFARIFAEVLPDRAGEFFASRQIQSTTNAMIRMYYQPGIEPTMRVVHHVRPGFNEVWDIQGVIPVQSRQYELRLMCLKRDAEGYRRGIDIENTAAPDVNDIAEDVSGDSLLISGDSTDITADAT